MKKTSFSRRAFSKTLAAAPWVLRAQQAPLRARIKIDTERVIDDIDPKIYGNFIEHLLHRFPYLHILTIGVRGWTAHHLVTGSHYCYITAAEVINGRGAASVNRFCDGHPVYITTDIDVLDPSIAPEVAYACPAGLTLPQLQTLISIATRSVPVRVPPASACL